jgi:hypothetical protein
MGGRALNARTFMESLKESLPWGHSAQALVIRVPLRSRYSVLFAPLKATLAVAIPQRSLVYWGVAPVGTEHPLASYRATSQCANNQGG